MSNRNVSRLFIHGEQSNHWIGYTVRPARDDGGHRPSGRRQLSVGRARLHREHDGEYRASRVCNSARIRTVHIAVVNGTLGFSYRGDTRRAGHGPGEYRFTHSICGTSVPPGGGFSVCSVVLWNAVESKLSSNPSDIGVTFREWLTRPKALCHSQRLTNRLLGRLGWLPQTKTERNVRSMDCLTSIASTL